MSRLSKLIREPLIHFVLLGGLIFAFSGAVKPPDGDQTIRITPELVEAIAADYERKRGEAPRSEQVESLVEGWLEDELLHREASRLEMGAGDPVVRRRLVQAMRFLVEDQALIPDPSDNDLARWLVEHADRYRLPAQLSFEHRFFARRQGDAKAKARAEASLKTGASGDPFVHGLSISGMSRARVETSFGAGFAGEVFELEPDSWSKPIASSFGYHLVLVTAKQSTRVGSLDEVRTRVVADWLANQRDEAVSKTISSLRERYTVLREDLL